MGKAVKKIHTFLVAALTAGLTVLRAVQLCLYTDGRSGYIVKGAEGTIAVFYSASLLLVIAVLAVLLKRDKSSVSNPFEKSSPALRVFSMLAGASMFCDFIFRIIISYNYITEAQSPQLNYFIPLCISAAASLICAFYFIAVGIVFNNDKYSFGELRYLHIIPLLWAVSVLVTCLTENIDVIYSEERLLHYAVLIFAIVFYIFFISSADREDGFVPLGAFAVLYGLFSFVAAVPRLIAFINGVRFGYSDFSTLAYLFTGIFALVLSKNIFGQKKKD